MSTLLWVGVAVPHAAAQETTAARPPEPPSAEQAAASSPASVDDEPIHYTVERVEFRGNTSTRRSVLEHFVPVERGDVLDINDPMIESIRWRLLGTGWFERVELSLARGQERGWVVLVVEVEERNTLVIQRGTAGVSKVVRDEGEDPDFEPYIGLGVAETNLLGLGTGLAATAVVTRWQWGVELRYSDPRFLGSGFDLNLRGFFNKAREFFGKENKPLVSIRCPEDREECPEDVEANTAVVRYRRGGLSIGTGHDITRALRYTLDWQGELIDVTDKPDAASTPRGSEIVPIDFRIRDGLSVVSAARLGLVYDRRNDPAMPSRGHLLRFRGTVASGLIGSNYDFTRLEAAAEQWFPLPWGHVLRVGGFVGSLFGNAPFFYHFYAADLTDLIPSRLLGLNLDHRGPPNLLGTSIAEMRKQQLAGRIDVGYSLPLHRGGGGIRAVDGYFTLGLYALADRDDLQVAIPGYEGLSRVPVDLTFDVGVRADTTWGLFQLGFSSVIGFIPLFEGDQ